MTKCQSFGAGILFVFIYLSYAGQMIFKRKIKIIIYDQTISR